MGFKDIKYDIPVAHGIWHIQLVSPFNWSPNTIKFVAEASGGPLDAIFTYHSGNGRISLDRGTRINTRASDDVKNLQVGITSLGGQKLMHFLENLYNKCKIQ